MISDVRTRSLDGAVYNDVMEMWMIPQADPFALANVQAAYDVLASERSQQKLSRAEAAEFSESETLEPTHYALRIYPRTEEEQWHVERMEDVDFIYTPFNYTGLSPEEAERVPKTRAEIASPFEVSPYTVTYDYTDATDGGPTGPATYRLPILYTVWPVSKPLPDDLEYKMDYEVFLPHEAARTRSGGSLQALEAEAISLALGVPVAEPQHSTRAANAEHTGRLMTYDESAGINAPLCNLFLKLQLGTQIHWGTATDHSGYFRIPYQSGVSNFTVNLYYEHPGHSYRVVADDRATTPIILNLGLLSDVLPPDAWGANPTSVTVLPQDDRQATEIARAANYFFCGQNIFPKSVPVGGVTIRAHDGSNGIAAGSFSKPSTINIWRNYSVIGTVLHEIGHFTHYTYSPNDFQFPEDGFLIESFASYVGWYLGQEYYKSLGWMHPGGTPGIVSNDARQGWNKNYSATFRLGYKYGWYSPLFVDLTDDDNQKLSFSPSCPDDNITGVPASAIWNIVKNTTSWEQCQARLQNYVGIYYSAADFNAWIVDFEHWINNYNN